MKRLFLALGVVALILIVAGCGALAALSLAPQGSRDVGRPAFAPMATPAPAPGAVRSAAPESSALKATDTASINVTDRLIIRNGNIILIVKDVQDSISKVTDIANAAGGLVLRSDSRHEDEKLLATVTIKVPVEAFDATLEKLRKLAVKVDAENTSSQDVTEEYVDLEARLKVHEATEQQLLKFLESTKNVDESLKVYRELNTVRAQIESLKGRMNYLQKSADMSTIVVQLRPEEKEKPIVEEDGWNPLGVVYAALRALVRALQGLVNLAIWLVLVVLPVVVIVGAAFLILRAVWRRLHRQPAK